MTSAQEGGRPQRGGVGPKQTNKDNGGGVSKNPTYLRTSYMETPLKVF